MREFLVHSVFFGAAVSLVGYGRQRLWRGPRCVHLRPALHLREQPPALPRHPLVRA